MGLDNYTSIVYGWKINGQKSVEKFSDDLEKINEDWWDEVDGAVIYDNMQGNYVYYGAVLSHYDSDEGGEVIINDKLIEKSKAKFNKWQEKHPKYKEVFDKYKKGKEPQLYVFQNIW